MRLEEAYSIPLVEERISPPPDSVGKDPMGRFLRLLVPLLSRACRRLRSGIDEIATGRSASFLNPSEIERMLYASLPSRLLWMLDRTLVLELNVARLQGRLSGSTPQERFDNFVGRLGQTEMARGLFLEYPVLARQVVDRHAIRGATRRQCRSESVLSGNVLLTEFCEDRSYGNAGPRDSGIAAPRFISAVQRIHERVARRQPAVGRPGVASRGERLVAEGTVVKSGRTLVITRGEVHATAAGKRTLVAIMQQTLMVMHGMADA
jgi:hypothetical protein